MEAMIIVILLGAGWAIFSGIREGLQDREREKARMAYLESLVQLKNAPSNADIKQETLYLGRVYSRLTHNKKGITLFDEVSLMNDISAACATSNLALPVDAPEPSTGTSVETRLRTLVDLKDKGLIDATEYERRRTEILRSI